MQLLPRSIAGRRVRPLSYITLPLAIAGVGTYLIVRSIFGGGEVAVPNYPSNADMPATAVAAAAAQPAPPEAVQRFLGYLESDLARVECGYENCTAEELQPYLDLARRQVASESAGGKRVPFNGVVADAYVYENDKLVKVEGKKLLLRQGKSSQSSSQSSVIVEMDCGPADAMGCDAETLRKINDQSVGAHNFIVAALQPSKKPGIYVTVSPDGKRTNVTSYNETKYPNHIAMLRQSQTAFYPWYVTDDFSQMVYEMAVKVDIALGLSSEGFLSDFWGNHVEWRWVGRTPVANIGNYFKHRSQAGLGQEVDVALLKDGFDDTMFAQLAQRLEGKRARWEQFKAEAKAVAGKDLPTLDLLDGEVNLYRELESGKGKQSYNFDSKGRKAIAHANSRSRAEKERWTEQRNAFERKTLAKAKSFRA